MVSQQKIAVGTLAAAIIGIIGAVYILRELPKIRKNEQPSTNLVQKVERESPYEKDFPVGKILTIFARDYVESRGKKLGDYDLRGVVGGPVSGVNGYVGNTVPVGTEVVVDYQPLHSYPGGIGIALIPKKKTQ